MFTAVMIGWAVASVILWGLDGWAAVRAEMAETERVLAWSRSRSSR